MSFYDFVKAKYLASVPTDKIESKTLEKIISTNIWPADYIEREGSMIHIYDSGVSIMEIFDFFKIRMPWLKLQLMNQEVLEQKPQDLLAVKFICFNQLAGLLAEAHMNFSKAFDRSLATELGVVREPTIH